MKKARNFWRDLPQGGSRYGSVLTRLFLLLCLLATTQAGWADTTTSSIGMGYSNSSSRWKDSQENAITAQTTITTQQTFTRSYTESGKTFNFSLTISDGKIADGNFQITKDKTGSSLTITAPSGVTITGLSITPSADGLAETIASVGTLSGSGTSYTWSGSSNSVTLNFRPNSSKNIQFKNLTITYSTSSATTHSVTHTLSHVTATSGSTGSSAATEGSAYNAVFAANSGYQLPSTIDVTIGGSAATAGTDYTWNSSTGALSIPADKVTGDIAVSVTGTALPTYSVNTSGLTHGTVTASPTSAYAGQTVTLTIVSDENYTLSSISATDGNSASVALSGSGNTRTFTMPGSAVTISATFAEAATLTAESNRTWDFTNKSEWSTFSDLENAEIKQNIEFGAGTDITAEGSGKSQRVMTGAGNHFLHIKVAANSKVSIWAYAGSSRKLKVDEGSVGGTNLLEKTCNDDSFPAYNIYDTGNGEKDLYIYCPNNNVSIYKIAVAPTYAIESNITGSGNVTTKIGDETVTRAASGETVTITATPATGEQLSSLTVTKTDGGASVDVTSSNTFTMPAEAVTVNATFGAAATAAPTITPTTSTISGSQTITLACETAGAKIRYTTDGSAPTSSSTLYSSPFTLGSSATVKAIAYDSSNANPSAVVSKTYTVDATAPTLSSTSPTNGSTGRSTSGTVSLTFNEAVAVANASGITISPNTGVTWGTATVDGENPNKVNITVSGLANNTTYTVAVADGAITDAVGNAYAGSSFSFKTAAASTTTVLERRGSSSNSTFSNGTDTFTGASYSGTSSVSGGMSPLSSDQSSSVYRTGSTSSITITLNSTSASKIVIGATSSGSSSTRTLSTVKVNGTDVTSSVTLSPSPASVTGNSSVQRITVDGLNVPQRGTVTFTFDNNVQFYYFEVTSGSGDVPPTFTTSPADNASGVTVDAAVTLTADKDISAVGSTIAGTLNGAACTFNLSNDGSGNPRVLTLNKAANFANGTQYTVVLSAGQVQDGNGTANTATEFTFTTVAAVVPTIAFNNPTTSITVGGSTVTNTATKTNAGEAAISYSSSNTSVATVDPSTGEVTAQSAGNTVITASMTVGSTEYTASYNMTVNAASVASTKWDFTTLSSDEIAAMRANTDKLSEVTSDKYFKNQSWENPYNFKNSSGTDLNVTDGLSFGGGTSNNKFQYYYGDDKRIRIQSNAYYVQLPSQEKDTEIKITWKAISSSRTLTADNATVKGSSNKYAQLSNGTTGTSTFIVDATGTVKFTVSGTLDLYKIEVGSAVEVAAPTIDPASGTHTGENNKSVTVTTNATNSGTKTTYFVIGTAAAANAAAIADDGSKVTATGSAQTIDLSSYETDVVISAVTKYNDGSKDYYSPITTATYTYEGKVTPSVVGSEMDLHPGDFGDIIGHITITDAQGNPLRFGIEEGEEVNYEDYFTFTYSIDSGSASAATTAGVELSGGRLSVAESGTPTTGNGIKINITAVPKAAAADYVKGTTGETQYTGSLYAKVTAKGSSGFGYVDLYWDKDLTDASELKENTDYTATTISDLNFYELTVPNGRMLYLKNTGAVDIDDLCFYYKQSSSMPSMSLNHVDNKSGDQYNYRHGIPLITSDDGAGTVWIMIAGYKNTGVDSEGKKIWSRDGSFLRLKVNITAQAKQTAPRYEPAEATAHMNTSKPATAYTVDAANENKPNDEFEILSKFTSKDSELPIINHVNNSGTIYGVGSTSVYSTEVAKRQISGVQTVKKIESGKTYYYISSMSTLLYTFDFGTTLKLSEYEIDVTTNDNQITSGEITEPTVTATYWNKKTSKDVEITYANEYVTYEVVKSPKTDMGADGVTVNPTTGEISVNPKTLTGEAVIKVTYLGGFDESTSAARAGSAASNEPIEITTDKKRTGYTGAASTTYTINITNTAEYVPVIDPTGRKFANSLDVTVSAPDGNHFVRYMVVNDDDGTTPPTAEAVKTGGKLIDAGNRATTTIGADAEIGDKITVYAVAYFGEYTSRVVQETFEKVKPLPKPVFNPDGTETPYYYYNTAKLLEVTIMGTDGADIYYTFDDPNVSTASTPYDGQKKARVEGSKTIYAIAVKDGLQSEVAVSRYVWTLNIDAPVFYLGNDETILYPATAKTKEVTRTTNINLKATQGDIYYTLDGSDPSTDNGIKYTAGTPINLLKSVTAKAIAIDGDAISPITTMNFTIPEPTANDNDLWEAVEETTPGGTLAADGRVISIANGSPKAVKYITATFGGGHREVLGNTAWSNITMNEESQGSALDGVGKYSISVGSDVADETGAIYNHANAEGGSLTAVSDRTFKIPAQGAFVRFEPERDGELTIWALQSGALHYAQKGEFCSKFIRRRPVYMIDEKGKSITAKVTPVSSARLSSNWDNLQPDEFLDINTGSQNGDVNTYYSAQENTAIYTMYEKILAENTGFGVGKDIHPVPMHTSDIYNASGVGTNGVGDNINDGTGYVMLSGGYVKYTFDVKAGKTYYFFGSRTKVGIRGFRFVADDTTPADITLTEESTSNTSAISAAVNSTRHTTGFDRTLAQGKWAALVLPFSLSETQTKAVFGDDVQILHVDKVQNYYLNLVRHYYQMIVAGTPIFIKPSQDVNLADLDQYVQIESTSPETISIDGYNFTGYYNKTADGIAKGDYYMSKSGNLSQRTTDGTTALKSLRSILKSKTGQTAKLTMAQGVIYEVDQQPLDEPVVTPIEVIYDEATGDFTIINDDTIYNLNGQVVRKNATSLEGLPKGIYIVNGKKVSVK